MPILYLPITGVPKGEEMKKMLAVCVLAGVAWACLHFHFILLDSRIKVLAKSELTLAQTFVDARGAKKVRLLLDPDLAKAGIKDIIKEFPE